MTEQHYEVVTIDGHAIWLSEENEQVYARCRKCSFTGTGKTASEAEQEVHKAHRVLMLDERVTELKKKVAYLRDCMTLIDAPREDLYELFDIINNL